MKYAVSPSLQNSIISKYGLTVYETAVTSASMIEEGLVALKLHFTNNIKVHIIMQTDHEI